MSADNWTICPECVKLAKNLRAAFINKYCTKLDPYIYDEMLEQINLAVEHMKSYSNEEYEPDPKILKLMEEREIEVKVDKRIHVASDLLWVGEIATCLREDYEQGVTKEGNVYFYYSCQCNCGFEKKVSYNQEEDSIKVKHA